ncbi:MAG: hypothetical protein DCC68_24235 [Planctomycetota bacterium]|nr:MAG: hypothetical protein DCC68_24235 [Planctomycetota bacterium]
MPEFISPYVIAAEPSGNVVLTDVNYGEVYRGNPVTGTHVLLSGATIGYGEGPEFGYALGIAVVHVPEPSAIVLVGIGVAVASLCTLRRSAPGTAAGLSSNTDAAND